MPTWLKLIFKFKHGLISFEKLIAASSLIILLLLSMFQLFARNFFDTGFPHMEIITRHLILFIIFMGAALISEKNHHIKIDILTHFLSPQKQEQLLRPLLLISAIISAIFAWYSLGFWLDEWEYASSNERWSVYLALILPFGFAILSLHLFLLTITGIEHDTVKLSAPRRTGKHVSCTDIK